METIERGRNWAAVQLAMLNARRRRQAVSQGDAGGRRALWSALRALSLERPPQFDVPLAEHTTFRIGGSAWALAEPTTVEELSIVLGMSQEVGAETMIVGAGSNLLVRDGGFPGLVLKLAGDFQVIADLGPAHAGPGAGTMLVGAAVHLSRLVHRATARGYRSLLRLCGIPGSVGGAVVMNAGTDEAIGDLVRAVQIVDASGSTVIGQELCGFAYRTSALGRTGVVANVFLDAGPERASPELLKQIAAERRALRRATQPLEFPSAGSVFRNPPGDHAGRLIDACGLKGAERGGARISEVHANWIVNATGEASSDDVEGLIDLCRNEVARRFGVELELEIRIVGERP